MKTTFIFALMLFASLAFTQNHKVKVIAHFDTPKGFELLDSTFIEIEKCVYQNCGKIVKEINGLKRSDVFYYAISEDMTIAVAFKEESPNICGTVTHWDYTWLNQIYYPKYKKP